MYIYIQQKINKIDYRLENKKQALNQNTPQVSISTPVNNPVNIEECPKETSSVKNVYNRFGLNPKYVFENFVVGKTQNSTSTRSVFPIFSGYSGVISADCESFGSKLRAQDDNSKPHKLTSKKKRDPNLLVAISPPWFCNYSESRQGFQPGFPALH